jgi:predicted permease
VAEVTLACVLLVTGGLLVRSFRAVLDVDLGFAPEQRVAWEVDASRDFETYAEVIQYHHALVDRVAQVPGVEAVGLGDAVPLRKNRTWGFRVVGAPEDDDGGIEFFPHVVDAGYRAALGIELISGRDLTRDDTRDAQPVVLINESGARRAFPGEEPLGKRISLWDEREWEVVGVVADVRQLGPEIPAGVQVYFPFTQQADLSSPDLVVRSRRSTEEVAAAVGAAIQEVDPTLPTHEFWTMQSLVDRAMTARRFTLGVLGAFGAAALLLAGLGIYGVLAHSVAERTPEIGIRMALGASAPDVVRGVLGRTLVLAGTGIALGAALSLASARLVASLLFGVAAGDPVSYVWGGLALLVVAGGAAALPALRAARTTGIRALRAE